MDDRTLPSVRDGIRQQARMRKLLSSGNARQNPEEEMRQRVAEANHRARRVALLQVPDIIQNTGTQRSSGDASVWRSHQAEVLKPSSAVGFTQRKIGVQYSSELLSHSSAFSLGGWRKKTVFDPRLSVVAVGIGLVLSAYNPAVAMAPEPDVRKLMSEYLVELQTQWKANEKHYQSEQDRIHNLAEKARDTLCEVGELKYCKRAVKVTVTSYNPLLEQTDASPCHGAGGNVCEAYKQGKKPIALSHDFIATLGGGSFRMGDTVELQGGNCTGRYTVLDTMNSRWEFKADIFFPERSMNVGCKDVYLIKR